MKYDIKNRTINVWLPNKLFNKLEDSINSRKEQNIQPVLQLAQAAYLLNLVIYIPYTKKDKYEDGWVPICSEIHKGIRNFSKYMEFLVNENLLVRNGNNYSNKKNYCYSYRLPDPYHKHKIKVISLEGHKLFIEGRLAEMNRRMEVSDNTTGHLTKWLDPERFEIDKAAAMAMVAKKYPHARDINKSNHRIICIESIANGGWGYSREGDDDRLHSALTSFPKDLKPFITYEGRTLTSIDIRNSQPYMFSSLLRNLEPNSDNHIRTLLNKLLLIPNMFCGFDGPSNNGDLERFIAQVENGTIYDQYYHVLFKAGLVFQNCCGTFSYEEQTEAGTRTKKFNNQRDLGKDIMMKTLFSSLNNRHGIIKAFDEEFPTVYKIMQKIKGIKPRKKNFFPVLLQNIEADCILDHCTKLMSSEHPDMPLFTIHDSIVTTEENLGILKESFEKHLKNYFGNIPELKPDSWS
ncbi:hypothetical protein [Maribacter aestuarii]|uniref:hypothetical protein n=1 Tax=Maribacter aestuarii TaxID=1130723 RepID=UPI0025A668EC|nr:hypothetical protein [Maribacter aestuarii]